MKILVACIDMVLQNTMRQPWYYMNSIINGLFKRGHDVYILTNKENGLLNKNKTIILKNFRSFPKGISEDAVDSVKQHNFDVIFWSLGLTDFFFRRKIDIFNIPVIGVVTSPIYFPKELLFLGCDLFYSRNLIKQFFLGTFLTKGRIKNLFSLSNLKAIIFECKGTRDRFIASDDIAKKAYVVIPPLPEYYYDLLNSVREKNTEIKKNDFFKILFLGPPLFLRGIDTVVRAFKIVHREMKNSKLCILSRVESREMLKHEKRLRALIVEENLGESVEIISGMLNKEEIIKHTLSSNVVCLPFKITISDVPMVILEVLATGVPLITTDIAGVGEFLNGSCFIVPKGDSQSIAEKLKHIYENKIGRIKDQAYYMNQEIGFQIEEVLKRAIS